MKQITTIIENPTGLHARPAKLFVNAAKQFRANIRVQHGAKKANAKSLISMLTLGVERGSEITIEVEGEDEEAAVAALAGLIAAGLGEGERMETLAAPPPAAPAPPAPAPQSADDAPANRIKGIGASPGIAVGPIFQFTRSAVEVEETFAGATEEHTRLQQAIERARGQLTTLHKQMLNRGVALEAAIFEVHREILDDPELLEAVVAKIDGGSNAARAWQTTIDHRADMLRGLSDALLAARAADVQDVGYRVLRLLVGAEEESLRLPDHPVIIVAHDLAPSHTASLDRAKVLGFCTAAGGPTAHTAIIARALSLPAVVGAGERVLALANGEMVILDGESGLLALSPDPQAVAQAQAAQQRLQERRAAALQSAAEPATTTDGHRVEIVANVGSLKDAEEAMKLGAEGIGLLRTEFLFLGREAAPSEQEQFETYAGIIHAMQGQPVIVRTLDIGGDKPLPYIELLPEENPFLGERGIRLCLNRPDLLRQQLRAILRAANGNRVRIMFPMVADVGEWRRARALVEEVRAELSGPPLELGIMIEVPSAALMADIFAREVDFFSVGTNDLTQYTLAMDRMHPVMAGQADGLHPSVLRLIKLTADAAHAAGKWVGVCGELGADSQAVPILIGIGVDELSVSAPAIPLVKAQIRSLERSAALALASKALACATAAEVRAL